MAREPLRSLALAAVFAWGLACGEGEKSVEAPVDMARATLAEAPERVRGEVLRACDKWKPRAGGPCDPAAVERDQLACWLKKGLPALKVSIANDHRPRRRDHRVLLHHDFCMERRGWSFRNPDDRTLDGHRR